MIGMVAGFIPEWWPASNRKTWPDWIGIRTLTERRRPVYWRNGLRSCDPCILANR